MTRGPFADTVDKDQTAENMQSDLSSTLTRIIFEMAKLGFTLLPLKVLFYVLRNATVYKTTKF